MGTKLGASIRQKRLARQGLALAALRLRSGEVDGCKTRWLTGMVEPRPGELVFTSAVSGILFLKREPVTLPVTRLHDPRPTTFWESIRLFNYSTMVPVSVEGGEVLLALESQTVDWVTSTVAGRPAESPM